MTSPEWDAANEDDSDRFPQTPHASAPESTESHERGSRVASDPARVARYAEAIDRLYLHTVGGGVHSIEDIARAVVSVADEEHAALVAEVERLRHASKQNAVQASRADRRADRLEARAEAAEAKVAKVEALILVLNNDPDYLVPKRIVGDRLRAALADAPAEQRAEGGA